MNGMTQLETQEELRSALAEVEEWEKDQKKLMIWDRMARLPFKLLDKATPKFIHDKVGQLLDEIGGYIQNGGNYLVAGKMVGELLAERNQAAGGTGSGPYPVKIMDEAAQRLTETRRNMATAQGATTGFGGIFTLAADIPAILGLSLKVIQEIALCYGYDPTTKEERIFTVKVMQFASSDIVGKQAILQELDQLDAAAEGRAPGTETAVSKIQGWREVMTVYRDNWGWKKMLQAVPIAGMFFGAYTNRKALEDVAEAAHMLYKKRRIMARLAEMGGGTL